MLLVNGLHASLRVPFCARMLSDDSRARIPAMLFALPQHGLRGDVLRYACSMLLHKLPNDVPIDELTLHGTASHGDSEERYYCSNGGFRVEA